MVLLGVRRGVRLVQVIILPLEKSRGSWHIVLVTEAYCVSKEFFFFQTFYTSNVILSQAQIVIQRNTGIIAWNFFFPRKVKGQRIMLKFSVSFPSVHFWVISDFTYPVGSESRTLRSAGTLRKSSRCKLNEKTVS